MLSGLRYLKRLINTKRRFADTRDSINRPSWIIDAIDPTDRELEDGDRVCVPSDKSEDIIGVNHPAIVREIPQIW